MFKIFFTNFGYGLDHIFQNFEEVKIAVKKHGFQCKILENKNDAWVHVCSYCPMGNFNWL